MSGLDKEVKIENCATCKHLKFIRHGEQYCGQTNLPIDLTDSCDLFSSNEEIIPPKKSNKISRFALITTLLVIAIFLVKFNGAIKTLERKKQLNENIRIASDAMKKAMFLHEINQETDRNNKTIRRVYFAPYKELSKLDFERNLRDSYMTVNDSLNSYDTIFVEDIVYYSSNNIDSTLLLFRAKGTSIKSYNFRIFKRKE